MLWETYDFALGKFVDLEEEFDFLQKDLQRYCCQQVKKDFEESGDVHPAPIQEILDIDLGEEIIAETLLKDFERTVLALKGFYNKQLVSSKELKQYYSEHPHEVPEDKEVSTRSFEELIEGTHQLRDQILESFKKAKETLTS